jgi:hypothetical protein
MSQWYHNGVTGMLYLASRHPLHVTVTIAPVGEVLVMAVVMMIITILVVVVVVFL